MVNQAVKPLPKWLMQSYAKIWQRHRDGQLDHPDIMRILGKKHASIVLCYLKKNGWVEITLNPDDSRKRLYRLKSPEKAVEEMAR
jgi:hypothetical protein